MSFLKKLERKVLRPVGRIIKKAVSWITGLQEFDASDFDRGYLLNKQSNVEPIPVIYGERKVGGTRVFVATSGTNNQFLYVVLVLCEGEINQIGDVYINDIISTDAKYTGKVIITKYVGTDSQTADATLTAAGIGWTANHRLRGLAYLAMRFTYDQDTFGGGIPDVTCIVQGKKCFDPRTSTTIYTRNPAVCLRDYLVNTRYGKGLGTTLIDSASFIAAANKCDASISKYTGQPANQPIFQFNGIINTGETLFDNVKVFLASMRGIFPFSDGKYSLIMEDNYSSTFTFNTDNILSDIRVSSIPKSQQYNRVTAKFTNPLANWQLDSVTWPAAGSSDYTSFLAADSGVELVGEISLPGTTDYYAARDLARIVCLDSRLAKLTCNFSATSAALQCAVGDVVTLTHASVGFTDKTFRVTDLQLLDTGDVVVGLKEHVASIYPWVVASEAPALLATTLPNPLTVQPPTSIVVLETTYLGADGTLVPEIAIAWTPANDAFVEQYEFQYKLSSTSNWFSVITVEPRFITAYADVGQNYDIRVRAINGLGVRSAFAESSYTVAGDTTAPALPTNLSVTASINTRTVKWTRPTAKDYSHSEVWGATTVAGTYTLIGKGADEFVHVGVDNATQYHYKLKSVDFSGNASALTTAVSYSPSVGAITSFTATETAYLSADGTVIPVVVVTWAHPSPASVTSYEFQYKKSTDSNYLSIITDEPRIELRNLVIGQLYNGRARAIDNVNNKSDWTSSNYTPVGDTTAPATPTGLVIVGSYNEAVGKWDRCTDKDYKETILYASLTNDFATATEQVRISGTTVTYYNLPISTTYYVWLRHVDFTGNLSATSAAVMFTTTAGITTSQIADGAVTSGKLVANAATVFYGIAETFSPEVSIAKTSSNDYTDWTSLGYATVDFAGNPIESLVYNISVNFEGQGSDSHIISVALVVKSAIVGRYDQSIVGTQDVTIAGTATLSWADISPTSGTEVDFYCYVKVAASGTDVHALSAYFNLLGSRK
jgi:predicted phage tail protein